MQDKYIELRTRQTFGDVINTYFEFLKTNIKPFLNLYLRYNFISFILFFLAAYLLTNGFLGMAGSDFRFGVFDTENYQQYIIAGAIILVLVIIGVTLLNYSFVSSYMTEYVLTKNKIVKKQIWKNITFNFGTIVIFVLIGVAIYIGYLIVSVIFSFIPLIGMFVQYGLNFMISAFFGLTFIAIFEKNEGIGAAMGEGFKLTFSQFLKVVGYGLVIGILNMLLTALILAIPGFIMFFYVMFTLQSGLEIYESSFASVIFTLTLSIFIIAFIFAQALSQMAYGVLYYNLHEGEYNTFLQSKIDKIGEQHV